MTTIYLIRHSETETKRNCLIHGWLDTKVSEQGVLQIEALSRRFSSIGIHAVYSSDLSRAVATAEVICTWNALVQNDREWTELFLAPSPAWRAPGGESFGEVRMRVGKVLKEITSHHHGQLVAMASLGAAIRQILAMFHRLYYTQILVRKSTWFSPAIERLLSIIKEFSPENEDAPAAIL